MIVRVRHKGLKGLFETGSTRGVRTEHARRLRLILGRLNASASPRDMDLPGLRLHHLKGRLVFRFDGADATDVDYLDYH